MNCKRVFRIGICGDWVEIYERMPPRPRLEGQFFLAYRKRYQGKVLPLMTGLTHGGVESIRRTLGQRPGFTLSQALTQLVLLIGERVNGPAYSFVPTAAR